MTNYILNWINHRFSKIKEVPASDDKKVAIIQSIIDLCLDSIAKLLVDFAEVNPIKTCRDYRETSNSLAEIKRGNRQYFLFDEDKSLIYIDFTLELTEKILETIRFIVTKPEMTLSTDAINELYLFRDRFIRLYEDYLKFEEGSCDVSQLTKVISDDASLIKHIINEHSLIMQHEDYEDGSTSYSYLMLLYYLHSCLNSLKKLIKTTFSFS